MKKNVVLAMHSGVVEVVVGDAVGDLSSSRVGQSYKRESKLASTVWKGQVFD